MMKRSLRALRRRGLMLVAVPFVAVTISAFAFSAMPLGAAADSERPREPTAERSVLLTVKRGLNAELAFSHPDPALRALPNQSRDAEVLVRLERSAGSTASDGAGYDYRLSFFGAVAGEYNLSEWVVHRDGSPLAAEESLPPQWVRVVSELPPGQGTSLYEIADPTVWAPRGYRAL